MKNQQKQEAEYKNKAGTAWSHSYLNQKPWHPLSYPNQRRKWIAEQTQSERQRKAEEVAREFSQEQEFFRQSALLSKKEKEKAEAMQALSFMYMRPPGYNAESARAAEIADEIRNQGDSGSQVERPEPELPPKRKPRVLDIYGRPVPTEEEFPALKNAPRLETGTVARAKPFGIEIRNVKCARCGNFGHQSGDRECLMKDTIMPNEQARLKRDDPLTAIMTRTEGSKWELKQKLGTMSPPRGGGKPDDPNQQILAEEIYDEYGGFLADGEGFADMIATLSRDQVKPKKRKEKKKRKKRRSSSSESETSSTSSSDSDKRSKKRHRDGRNRHGKSKRGDSEEEESGRPKESRNHKDRPHRERERKNHEYGMKESRSHRDEYNHHNPKETKSQEEDEIGGPRESSRSHKDEHYHRSKRERKVQEEDDIEEYSHHRDSKSWGDERRNHRHRKKRPDDERRHEGGNSRDRHHEFSERHDS